MTASALLPATATAQTWIGGAIGADVQRYSGDPSLDRLSGSSAGWLIAGAVQVARHVTVRVDATRSAAATDLRRTPIDVDGRSLSVESSVQRRLWAIDAQAGFTQRMSARIDVAFTGGVAFTTVDRTFRTNAPELLLVRPSNVDAAPIVTRYTDRFVAVAAGADVVAHLHGPLSALAGVRAQRLALDADLGGISVRPFAGAAWVF